ncbi:MAG: 3-mercaptopyruvate sulfurtransferase [Alphaproteobacteria bacterium]|jgi:thiosulfate/3-mercaptopyruvate sulfurtransferase|nr:3-mercaptopyruvate sulfurtransferase [Alphaproteobacteria bacterium]
MADTEPAALLGTEWLADHLGDPAVRVVDGSWHLPTLDRDPKAEYVAGHIPGAVFFDIDGIADRSNPLPHMLPDPATFAAQVGALGLGDDAHIVAYDATGVGSAARVWWNFRVFGHHRVSVLDGGMAKWRAEGRPVETGAVEPEPARFNARFDATLVRDLAAVRANIATGREQVLDARAAGRFVGTEPEPREGLRGGHIPGSHNLPFLDLYDPDTKTLKPPTELVRLYRAAGIDPDRPVVTSCGSGITACNLALGLDLIGARRVAVYDGSWTEWGGRADTPVET